MGDLDFHHQLEAICSNASVALFVTDSQGNCRYMNPAAEALTGYTLQETLGRSLHELIHHHRPDGSCYSARDCPLGRGMPQREKEMGQETLVHKSGRFCQVAFTASPVKEAGASVGTVIEMYDIGQQLRAQEALKTQAEADAFRVSLADALRPLTDARAIQRTAVRALGEHLRVARTHYAEYNADLGQAIIREEYAVGVPRAEGPRRPGGYRRIFGRDFREGRTLIVDDVAADRRLTDEERAEYDGLGVASVVVVPLVRNGRFAVSLTVSDSKPRHWSEGDVMIIRETAERAWLAIERCRAEEDVRGSERRFRELADSMPQLVWFANAQGAIEYYNARVREYGGIEPEESGHWHWRPVVHPDDVEATDAAWQRAVATGELYQIEHRVRMCDGSFRWHLSRSSPVKDEAGTVVRWFGTATDVHELKQAEQALSAANEKLRESNRLKDEFMAVVSHELRTPLTSIALHAELLRKRPQAAGRIAPIILRNAEAQIRIVDDLLDNARIARGTLSFDFEPVNLKTLVGDLAEHYGDRLQETGLELSLELEPLTVRGDPLRLRQVLWNLLENAIRHTPESGHIRIALARRRERAVLTVADDGEGVDPEFVPHIFDLFRQEAPSANREHGGLGLGLHLVKGIAQAHGGSVRAASSGHGTGLEITMELPLAV